MPRKQRMRSRKRKDGPPEFGESRPISLDRWQRHREALMKEEARGGRRPEEFWYYAKGMPPPERDQEAATLFEMGELGKSELTRLMREWHERWEKAQVPDFGYCIGHKNPNDTEAL